jgi:hypothetical protein
MSIGMTADAIKDLAAAEKLAGPQPSILTTKAVALSNDGYIYMYIHIYTYIYIHIYIYIYRHIYIHI